MQQRSQRYVRRQRGWIGQGAGSQDPAGEEGVRATEADRKSVLRGRQRRSHFGKRLDTTSAIVGMTPDDQAWIAKSQAHITPHIAEVAEDDRYRFVAWVMSVNPVIRLVFGGE